MVGRPLSDEDVEAILAAAARDDVRAAMGDLYADLDAAIEAYQPVCRNRGVCCRFGEYGHRLFVTTLEAAYGAASYVVPVELSPADSCPFHVDGGCRARTGRPVGCRVFYCDPATQQWQGPLTEHYLDRLRTMHHDLGVSYAYAEWLHVLRSLRRKAYGNP